MNRKILKRSIIILIGVLLVLSLLNIKRYSINIHKEGSFNINTPITFKLNTKEYGKSKALGDINVNIYNVHNNDEKLETTIHPYIDNKYQFVFTPSVPGQYHFIVSYQPPTNDSPIVISQKFSVK